MKKGFHLEKGYFSTYLYPLGIEIFIDEGIQFSFIFFKYEMSISIGRNYTIFGDIVERAISVKSQLESEKKFNA